MSKGVLHVPAPTAFYRRSKSNLISRVDRHSTCRCIGKPNAHIAAHADKKPRVLQYRIDPMISMLRLCRALVGYLISDEVNRELRGTINCCTAAAAEGTRKARFSPTKECAHRLASVPKPSYLISYVFVPKGPPEALPKFVGKELSMPDRMIKATRGTVPATALVEETACFWPPCTSESVSNHSPVR